MRSPRIWIAAAAAAALVIALGALSASARGDPAGNAVTEWNLIAVNTLIGLPGPAGGAPPSSQIHMGMVQGAVYDAVNATEPKHYRPYLLTRRFSARASKEAAVATAAYRVLSDIVATVPNISEAARASLLQSLSSQYNASLASIPEGPFKDQGIAAGNAAADAMIAAREGDGRFGPSPWVSNAGPGHWQPLVNPSTNQPILDPTPWVGNVKPFLLQSQSQFRTAGPLPLTSAAYAAEVNEVRALGSLNSALRTPTQTYIALWWQSTPIAMWNQVGRELIARQGLDVADSARLLAMQNLAAADAHINCWNDKYYWDFWRPWQAIRRADEDSNPLTDPPDRTWTPLTATPPYPEHPSGHLCNDGAHTRVLLMFFGDTPEGGFDVTSGALNTGGPAMRHFESFSATLAELIEARIWLGIHFRTADVQAERLGRSVAEYMAANYFQPVGRG